MESKVEKLKDSQIKAQIIASAEEVEKHVANTYKDIARKYNFPGFRKGKAPRPVIDNAMGREVVLAAATEDLVNDLYPEFIEEQKLFPVGNPQFDNTDTVCEPGKPYTVELTLSVKPEVELDSYKPVEVEVPIQEATPLEIEGQLQAITQHYIANQEDGKTPELTDEWVKETLGLDSVDDLKKDIADSIAMQKQRVIPQIKENGAAMQLVDRVKGDIPAAMVEQMESELLQDFFTQLQRYGITFDAYMKDRGIDNAQFKEDIKRQAEDEAKRALALDAWARNKGLQVTEDEVVAEFEKSGADNPKKLMEEWRKTGRLYLIREALLRSKAMEDVLDTAKITEVDFAAKEEKEKKKTPSKKAAAKKDNQTDSDQKPKKKSASKKED